MFINKFIYINLKYLKHLKRIIIQLLFKFFNNHTYDTTKKLPLRG